MQRAKRGLRGARVRRVLVFAAVSSLAVVVLASVLITSVFSSAATAYDQGDPAVHAVAGKPLTIAIARTAGGPSEWRTYARAIKRIGDVTGRPVRVRYALRRDEIVGLVESHEVDAGFLCTNCYIELADDPGVSLIATPRIAGERMDAGVLVVRASSSYSSLKDLTGRRVGVTEPRSLGGHAYLYWLAKRERIDVAHSLHVVQGESQEQNLKSLLAGDMEAVVVNRSQLAMWDSAELTVISHSPEFGMPPFVAGSTVDTATRSAMKQALLSMGPSAEETCSLVHGFTAVDARDYAFARELARYSPEPRGSR